MASHLQNLSAFDPEDIPPAKGMKFGIVIADWNREITHNLLKGAIQTLEHFGAVEKDIFIHHVPGSFELPLGAQLIAESLKPDAVICLGCVIQGETRHFDYICQGVTQGITELNLKFNLPFIFGVLTTDTLDQAMDRSGGKHGNKGDEAAVSAIRMTHLKRSLGQ
jgi:6,7-dimethyl-8-ribityllumazine synthase